MTTVSVIVTTYNWPEALHLVLLGLEQQSLLPSEVIIADDGSKAQTAECIQYWQKRLPFPLKHVWQEDLGFRAAMVRNRALAQASFEYILFLDGDCVLPPWGLQEHLSLAEPGFFVSGNRLLLTEQHTQAVFKDPSLLQDWGCFRWWRLAQSGACNSAMPLWRLPLGFLRKMFAHKWKGAKTCNLAIWKKDLFAINGFNEAFVGWGFEDSELVIRLLRYGVRRKEGRFATGVVHLWHLERSRQCVDDNLARLKEIQNLGIYKTEQGLHQYLSALRCGII